MTTAEKKSALAVAGLSEISVSASAEALAERDRLLAMARRGKSVTDAASAQRATDVLKELKQFTRGMEAARKETKEPVLALSRDIDALAKQLTEDIDREASRISSLIGEWQAEQNRIAEEARRKAYEEEQRIRREAEAREQAERERLAAEEAKRLEAQRAEQQALAEKAARARSEKRRAELEAQAQAAAERAAREAEEARKRADAEGLKRDEQTALRIGQAHASAAIVSAAKPEGIAARRNVEFEVTDIVALYEACAPLVKLEPNTAAIKAALKQLPEGKTLPGVRHWFTTAAIVR